MGQIYTYSRSIDTDNNVWHDINTRPNRNKWIITYGEKYGLVIHIKDFNWTSAIIYENFHKWCYAEKLINKDLKSC